MLKLLMLLFVFVFVGCSSGEKSADTSSRSDSFSDGNDEIDEEGMEEESPKRSKKKRSDDAGESANYADLVDAINDGSERKVERNVRKLLAEDSKDVKALNALGVHYLKNKKYGLAKLIFNKVLL